MVFIHYWLYAKIIEYIFFHKENVGTNRILQKYNSKLFARDIYLDIANARIDRTKKLKTHLKRNSHLEQIFHEQIIPRIKKMVDDKKTSSTFKIKTIPKRKQKPKIKYGARFASNGLVNKKNHNYY